MKFKLIPILIVLALLFVPTSAARAQSPGGDVVLLGENYVVKSGETLNGSAVIIGGNLTVEKDAKVSGDVVVIGGNLNLEGDVSGSAVIIGGNAVSSAGVSGDMVAIGGQISLTKTASVKGNVVLLGGQVSREEGAKVGGEVVENAPLAPSAPGVPPSPGAPNLAGYDNPLWEIAMEFGKAVIFAAFAMLLALFLQPQMERVSDAIVRQPFVTGGFGLLTAILSPLAVLLMVVTIILIPIALLFILLVLPAIWIFGMVALGQEIGERFIAAIRQDWSPVFTAGLGTFLLSFTLGAASAIPVVGCVSGLISLLVSLTAIGGVVKAWLDSRAPQKPSAPVAAEIPPAS